MPLSGVDKKLEAIRGTNRPRLVGKIVSEQEDAITVQAGGCIIEVPLRHVVEKGQKGEEAELTLSDDAQLLVSAHVSIKQGFTADDVFGRLVPDVLASNCNCNCNSSLVAEGANCNCNCNCNSSLEVEMPTSLPTSLSFRRPFTGGANRMFGG